MHSSVDLYFAKVTSGLDHITFHPSDPPAARENFRQRVVRSGYLYGFFCQENRRISLELVRHLCSGGIPPGLLSELQQTMSRSGPVLRSVVKLCPKCSIPFSAITERYYRCGKSSHPYNIYKCQQCKDQDRIGEYSDLERLRPEGSNIFKNLTTDIRLVEWSRKHKNGKAIYWRLEARGICWTRCDEPTCCALYKYYSGARSLRTVTKHGQAIGKTMIKSPLQLRSGDTRIDPVPALRQSM